MHKKKGEIEIIDELEKTAWKFETKKIEIFVVCNPRPVLPHIMAHELDVTKTKKVQKRPAIKWAPRVKLKPKTLHNYVFYDYEFFWCFWLFFIKV